MVEDPKLEQHLAHFGINIFKMEKVWYTFRKGKYDVQVFANMVINK